MMESIFTKDQDLIFEDEHWGIYASTVDDKKCATMVRKSPSGPSREVVVMSLAYFEKWADAARSWMEKKGL